MTATKTSIVLTIFSVLSLLPFVVAQFQFFDQMFGHGQRHQQQAPSGQWAAQADMVPCNAYLCPTTLYCVANPAECPCHYVEDKKCLIPDGEIKGAATVVCVRGTGGCAEVERLSNRWK